MAHRIDGRKLSRKQGPRLALYKNLTVSVLRYERVQTTEAKAKEIRGRVEQMITLAKRGDLAARRAVVAEFPNEPLVVTKLFDEIAPKYADRTSGLHPDRPPRPAHTATRLRSFRSSWCSHERNRRSSLPHGASRERAHCVRSERADEQRAAPRGRRPCDTAHGSNMTARTLPGSRFSLERGRSRENSKPHWRGSPAEAGSGSWRRVEPTPGSTPRAGDRIHRSEGQAGEGAGQGARRAAAGGRGNPRA